MITKDLHLAAAALKKGDVVGIPTETVYGLAANALDSRAVAKVYAMKNRPVDHPLIVHVSSFEEAKSLVTHFPEKAKLLVSRFWPGPLTLVLPKSNRVPDLTTGGMQSIAIRIPSKKETLDLIKLCGFPLAAPSANPFGRISPTTALHVEQSFGENVPLILEGGPCSVGVESTILSFLNEEPCVLRLGGLPLEELEELLGPVAQVGKSAKPIAPGMLPQHYAPKTPLKIFDPKAPISTGKIGLLTLNFIPSGYSFQAIEVLSADGNLEEAASSFYSALRRLDEAHLDWILAHCFPETGLGRALNDRLERASHLN